MSNSIFGSGGASYRNANKPAIVDTVWCGCWYKDVLEKVGLFDENWSTNQDWELNARLRSKGYTIYFEPKISARLLVRNSFSLMLRQYYRYGQGRAKSILRYPQLLKLRQIMPILFCCILVTLLFANKLMVAALLVFSFGLLYCFRGRLFHTSSISIKDIFQIMIIITGINTSWTSGLIYIFSKRFISWLIYKKNAVLKHIQDLCSKKK